MAINDSPTVGLSPTVLQVLDEFAAAMRADSGIPSAAAERLEKSLRQGSVPRPDDINAILFHSVEGGAE